MTKKKIKIEGMHCASCASIIDKNLRKADGIIDANVNFATSLASIDFNESKINLAKIKKIINDSGYQVAEKTANDNEEKY